MSTLLLTQIIGLVIDIEGSLKSIDDCRQYIKPESAEERYVAVPLQHNECELTALRDEAYNLQTELEYGGRVDAISVNLLAAQLSALQDKTTELCGLVKGA